MHEDSDCHLDHRFLGVGSWNAMLQCGTLEDCLVVVANPPGGEPVGEDELVALQESDRRLRVARIASLARMLNMPKEVQRHLLAVPLDRCDFVSRRMCWLVGMCHTGRMWVRHGVIACHRVSLVQERGVGKGKELPRCGGGFG